jgi:hypothetical protein
LQLACCFLAACGGSPDGKGTGDAPCGLANDAATCDAAAPAILFSPAALPLKIDILFVLDASAGSCQELAALPEAAKALLDGLAANRSSLDLRLAATSTFAADKGQFLYRPAKTWPPACNCDPPPACPETGPKVLTETTLDQLGCLLRMGQVYSYSDNMEQGLGSWWEALDPEGQNAEQSKAFLRSDAYLLVVILSDEDDCSISPDYRAPNSYCQEDADCSPGTCDVDVAYSQFMGTEVKLCSGIIKKDYYNKCAYLGEYLGEEKQACAYDQACSMCTTDADCGAGWTCQGSTVKKCRPKCWSFPTVASYQAPPGTPLFALEPVSDVHASVLGLKQDPNMLLAGFVVADAILKPTDEETAITPECKAESCLEDCADYVVQASASPGCAQDPDAADCEAYAKAKRECALQCFDWNMMDDAGPTGEAPFFCEGFGGKSFPGTRYVRLAELMGPAAVVTNICQPENLVPALDPIRDLVLRRTARVCLPSKVADGNALVVTLEAPGQAPVTLTEGDGPLTYSLQYPAPACCQPGTPPDCQGSQQALVLNFVADPQASVKITSK